MKIGIAFAGGAGRGAYEIGVWKAMHETGFDQVVSAVSGSSVGGLNEEELKDAFINKVFGVDPKKIKKEDIKYIRVFSSGITGKKIDLQKLNMPHVKEKDWENGFLERPEDFEELLKAVPVKTLEE